MNKLTNLLFDYCEEYNLCLEKSQVENIDFIMIIKNIPIGVIIKDWNRTIGVDTVIQSERAVKGTTRFSQFFILTNQYSYPARALADCISISLFTFKEFKEFIAKKLELTTN